MLFASFFWLLVIHALQKLRPRIRSLQKQLNPAAELRLRELQCEYSLIRSLSLHSCPTWRWEPGLGAGSLEQAAGVTASGSPLAFLLPREGHPVSQDLCDGGLNPTTSSTRYPWSQLSELWFSYMEKEPAPQEILQGLTLSTADGNVLSLNLKIHI